MQQLLQELDRTETKVLDSRKELLNRIESLIGEVNTAKANIVR